eukprot:gene12802-15024_t
MGAKYPYYQKHHFQIWRFFMPMFLTSGLVNLLFQFYFQLRFALYLERVWGTKKMAIVYCTSGVAGYLFSSVCEPYWISLGGLASGFGIMFCLLAELLFGADYLNKTQRTMWLVNMTVNLIIWIILALTNGGDWTCYVGASLMGFALGLLLLTSLPRIRKLAFAFIVAFFLMFIIIFYAFTTANY